MATTNFQIVTSVGTVVYAKDIRSNSELNLLRKLYSEYIEAYAVAWGCFSEGGGRIKYAPLEGTL